MRHSSVSAFQIAIPSGFQNGLPGDSSENMNRLELAPEPAVVALAGLLEALEVLLELGLGEEGGAVDAGQHRAVGVPAPVGAGDRVAA